MVHMEKVSMENAEKFHSEQLGEEKKIKREAMIELPSVPGFKQLSRTPVRVIKGKEKFIFEASSFGDAAAALEYAEREGIPALGIEKGSGFIDLNTRHIDGAKVEIRLGKRRGLPKGLAQHLEGENQHG